MRWIIFLAVAVSGLFYVKWLPYWDRAVVAAARHAIGASILTGKASQPPAASWGAALAYGLAYGKAIWKALVLGLLLGSAVQALIPGDWVWRTLGRSRFGSIVAGGLLGTPAMMCTCCAAPIVMGLRRQNASAGGAIAFWLGNTVLNPATLVFTGFVLGWRWTALRLLLGVPMVLGLGQLTNLLAARQGTGLADVAAPPPSTPESNGVLTRWLVILGRMTVRLVPEYILLVLLLGAGRAWLFPAIGPEVGNHLAWIVAFALAGAAFVIPTAGEVPIVQAMLALGVGAGPAAALLMTLPPVSLPSMAMLSGSFSPRLLAVVFGGVVLFGLAAAALAILLGF